MSATERMALFSGGGNRNTNPSKALVEFRAGKMTLSGNLVTPDKRKGSISFCHPKIRENYRFYRKSFLISQDFSKLVSLQSTKFELFMNVLSKRYGYG